MKIDFWKCSKSVSAICLSLSISVHYFAISQIIAVVINVDYYILYLLTFPIGENCLCSELLARAVIVIEH